MTPITQTAINLAITIAVILAIIFIPLWAWIAYILGFATGVILLVLPGSPVAAVLSLINVRLHPTIASQIPDDSLTTTQKPHRIKREER